MSFEAACFYIFKITQRSFYKLIEINKEMAEYIRKKIPDVFIKKTMLRSGSKRGKYFAEETSKVLKLIDEYNHGKNSNIVEQYPACQ